MLTSFKNIIDRAHALIQKMHKFPRLKKLLLNILQRAKACIAKTKTIQKYNRALVNQMYNDAQEIQNQINSIDLQQRVMESSFGFYDRMIIV